MTKLQELVGLGQSIWYDNIRRSLIDDGTIAKFRDEGVMGVTSNPSIFEKAIAQSADYDTEIAELVAAGKGIVEIYETLVIADIGRTADIFRSVYDQTNGGDGYVSIEVSPTLAHDTAGTIAEARRLFAALNRPNIMIKVPSTEEGIPAIETLIGEGINVNVTLIFSLSNYELVANAYIAGLMKLASTGGDVSQVASVASFFVSRVDSAVDKALAAVGNSALQGKIGIANAKAAYLRFDEIFSGDRWEKLAALGAVPQRPLWASTGTKNAAYSDVLYVDELIGAQTVNTVPPHTLDHFIDHGTVAATLGGGTDEALAQLQQLAEAGVDLAQITAELQTAGVASFAKAFEGLMGSLQTKRDKLEAENRFFQASVGAAESQIASALATMQADNVVGRIWDIDHTVWHSDPAEISNRLGWLKSPQVMREELGTLAELVAGVQADGYTDVLLLGMGGSSLAPEVFQFTFGSSDGHPRLAVLDSTHPEAVLAQANRLDLATSLFVVATKSGGTVETLSFFKYFYNATVAAVGVEQAGAHFVAITDPGSKLESLAQTYKFRTTLINDPDIGGRYSVLSYFGLTAAALIGMDVSLLLDRASKMACHCAADHVSMANPGLHLGAIMGEMAKNGRDKVTLITSPILASFGNWVEQLIAESTGKEGKGVLPVVGEAVGTPEMYGDDRLFVYLRLAGDDTHDAAVQALQDAGYPLVTLRLRDVYDLGGQFFLWEMATAISGHLLNIQPFDQPNVESAKILARQMVSSYMETGELPASDSVEPTAEALTEFLAQAVAGDYISLQAYVNSADDSLVALLEQLRDQLSSQTKLATTLGYGPRFLHSTGQLHKGDGGNGLFIQFTTDPVDNADIPNTAGEAASTMSFGVLVQSQSLGDGQALINENRRFIRFHLGADSAAGIKLLLA